jgi:hypothetical protein
MQCKGIKKLIDLQIKAIRDFIKDDPEFALTQLDRLQNYTDLLADIGNTYETAVVDTIERNNKRLGLV